MSPAFAPLQERITAKLVIQPDGCVVWTGARNRKGYGLVWNVFGSTYAHRAFYELMIGPIPPGMQIDHLCRNRACCNIEHMEVVTPRENALRGKSFSAINARKTHCANGHPYDEANTIRRGNRRECRTCRRGAQRRWRTNRNR
jgi:HNH endonuclease